ncbi:MAG: hypothetical protein LBT53_02565 [Puniceicoccales bacterium]|nr:hypothetical protein [Puniceicoccales bacterium]
MRPHLSKYRRIPPEAAAAFAAAMDDVLAVYQMPYDAHVPLICMDESSKQLIGEVHPPIGVAPGHGQVLDREYVRNGVGSIFVGIELRVQDITGVWGAATKFCAAAAPKTCG